MVTDSNEDLVVSGYIPDDFRRYVNPYHENLSMNDIERYRTEQKTMVISSFSLVDLFEILIILILILILILSIGKYEIRRDIKSCCTNTGIFNFSFSPKYCSLT